MIYEIFICIRDDKDDTFDDQVSKNYSFILQLFIRTFYDKSTWSEFASLYGSQAEGPWWRRNWINPLTDAMSDLFFVCPSRALAR